LFERLGKKCLCGQIACLPFMGYTRWQAGFVALFVAMTAGFGIASFEAPWVGHDKT
jgi:hypothetical protein